MRHSLKKGELTWHSSIGLNVPLSKACQEDLAAHGCFRDTRMPVSGVFENIEAGATIDEIVEQFDVTREQINAVLAFTARSLIPASLPAAKS